MINNWTFILLLLIAPAAIAQDHDGTLQSEEIVVIKAYQPILADAVKTSFYPRIRSVQTDPAPMDYTLPQKVLSISYKPLKMRPLAMPRSKHEKQYKAFFKVGYGTQSSPYLNAYYSSTRSKGNNWGLKGQHRSSTAGGDKTYAKTHLSVVTKHIGFDHIIKTEFNFDHAVNFFYSSNSFVTGTPGIDTAGNQVIILNKYDFEAPLKQRFSEFSGNFSLANRPTRSKQLAYEIRLRPSFLSSIFDAEELRLELDADFVKPMMGQDRLLFNFMGDYSNTNTTDSSGAQGVTVIGGMPAYYFRPGGWELKVGVILFMESYTLADSSKLHVFPDLRFQTDLIPKRLSFYTGWDGFIEKNTLGSFREQNPYLMWTANIDFPRTFYVVFNPDPITQEIIYKNTIKQRIYGGFFGKLGDKVGFDLQYAYKIWENVPYFVTDTFLVNQFNIVYDEKVEISQINVELSLASYDKIRIALKGEFSSYNLSTEARAWHTPDWKADVLFNYKLADKLRLAVDVFIFGETYSQLADEKLDQITDLNIALTYNYSKNISLFVNANNILDKKYRRWYDYPTYGTNIIGGLAFSL